MLLSDIYAKLHQFAVAATGYDNKKVIIANQNMPRQGKPFITIQVSGFKDNGTPIIKSLSDDGIQETVVSTRFVVSFQSYSDTLHEAEDILSTLGIQFKTELQNDIFQGQLALLRVIKNVTAIPVALNAQIESRAILEVEMTYNNLTTYAVGLIENVEITNQINNQVIIINTGASQ